MSLLNNIVKQQKIIILHIFIKKTQSTPLNEFKIAQDILKEIDYE